MDPFWFNAFFYLSRSWNVGTAVLSLDIDVIDDPKLLLMLLLFVMLNVAPPKFELIIVSAPHTGGFV